ncbi:MAG TPA: hypothetical protein VJK52_04705 [Candidatus Nanoarchaeia archaeon]|nr:hypothetical protein [Candidatus Nanoarchaeia archaeon]
MTTNLLERYVDKYVDVRLDPRASAEPQVRGFMTDTDGHFLHVFVPSDFEIEFAARNLGCYYHDKGRPEYNMHDRVINSDAVVSIETIVDPELVNMIDGTQAHLAAEDINSLRKFRAKSFVKNVGRHWYAFLNGEYERGLNYGDVEGILKLTRGNPTFCMTIIDHKKGSRLPTLPEVETHNPWLD